MACLDEKMCVYCLMVVEHRDWIGIFTPHANYLRGSIFELVPLTLHFVKKLKFQ